jgi:hypothetical protein
MKIKKKARKEFGVSRSSCACGDCQVNCRFMPGNLIPADLPRMIPQGVDPFQWAEANLLASPGALVSRGGVQSRIPTLVPAVKEDGSCIHLNAQGLCNIHRVAPFGCAFFSCTDGPESYELSARGLHAILDDEAEGGPYTLIWHHLHQLGKVQRPAEELRQRMRTFLDERDRK